jgi:putative selenate reductase
VSALRPFPFEALLRRLRRELAGGGPAFGLARRDWHLPDPDLDLSIAWAGRRAANPFGPAAGPHTQLAQNLVPCWLAGARVFELKTIQVMDGLAIPRPCIHAPHYGLNVEWSQELRLADSVSEYLKAAWLLEIMRRTRAGGQLSEGADLATMLDLSVGYSLEGVRSSAMAGALERIRDPRRDYQRLGDSLSAEERAFAGEPPAGPVADCITLSTFHGCPPGEVEAIASHLLDQSWSVVVKLNPTLCGEGRVREILHDRLGYTHLEPDPQAFRDDLYLDGAVDVLERLADKAGRLGLALGAKFSNTLVLRRDDTCFPPQAGPHMYLSGAPLLPLAVEAARQVADRLRAPVPFSFSAGLDADNAHELLACGFAPLTLCTDLLRRGGLGRLSRLLDRVAIQARGGELPESWRRLWPADTEEAQLGRRTALASTSARFLQEPRLRAAAVMKAPRQLDRVLERLDCVNCDLCLPVCPNGALFSWTLPGDPPRAQIGVLADACNACSQCETWCPEQGAPWRVKERWHQDRSSLAAAPEGLDGFCREGAAVVGRVDGAWLRLETGPAGEVLHVDGGAPQDPETLRERALAVRVGLLAPETPAGLLAGVEP